MSFLFPSFHTSRIRFSNRISRLQLSLFSNIILCIFIHSRIKLIYTHFLFILIKFHKVYFFSNIINTSKDESQSLYLKFLGDNIFKLIYFLSFSAPRMNAKRRVKLRRDPVMDKGHRSKYIIRAQITTIIEAPLRHSKLEI